VVKGLEGGTDASASGIPLTLIHSYLIEDWFTPVEGNAFLAGKAVVR
jgi:hypothetical protein